MLWVAMPPPELLVAISSLVLAWMAPPVQLVLMAPPPLLVGMLPSVLRPVLAAPLPQPVLPLAPLVLQWASDLAPPLH